MNNDDYWMAMWPTIRERAGRGILEICREQDGKLWGPTWIAIESRIIELQDIDPDVPICVIIDRLTEENLIPGL